MKKTATTTMMTMATSSHVMVSEQMIIIRTLISSEQLCERVCVCVRCGCTMAESDGKSSQNSLNETKDARKWEEKTTKV